MSAAPRSTTATRPARPPAREPFSASAAAPSSRCEETDALPDCPSCGGSDFRRDSIFEARQEHGATTANSRSRRRRAARLAGRRRARRCRRPGHCLACQDDDGEIEVFPIERGWTRIGRSATADLRLDDPSVSRRHALIVSEPGKPLRVLDDRSLNGVFLNGEMVEWGPLGDGDELAIGRYRLFALNAELPAPSSGHPHP